MPAYCSWFDNMVSPFALHGIICPILKEYSSRTLIAKLAKKSQGRTGMRSPFQDKLINRTYCYLTLASPTPRQMCVFYATVMTHGHHRSMSPMDVRRDQSECKSFFFVLIHWKDWICFQVGAVNSVQGERLYQTISAQPTHWRQSLPHERWKTYVWENT